MQSQAFRHVSYKILTQSRIRHDSSPYLPKHAIVNRMPDLNKTILLIENDPQICQLIADQSLRPAGFLVELADSIASGLQEVEKSPPDLIITSLNLPGLSGKDLIVAAASRSFTIPIIVLASKGQETDVLQALRLGAADYLLSPIREAEVINAVENALRKQRLTNELQNAIAQLEQVKADMVRQAQDFKDIFSINKLFIEAENLQSIYQNIASLVVHIGGAQQAWILTLDPLQCKYILQACVNTSEAMKSMLNLPFEDKFSALAGVSGQPITLHGEALKRFNNPDLLESAMVVPIQQDSRTTGTITLARQAAEPFTNQQKAMLELVAEYTSLLDQAFHRFTLIEHSLVLEQQACVYQQIEADLHRDILAQASLELHNPLNMLKENVDVLFNLDDREMNRDQAIALMDIREETQVLAEIAEGILINAQESRKRVEIVDLNEMVQQVVARYQPFAKMDHINFRLQFAEERAMVKVYSAQIARVIEGLVSNALKYSPPGGEISIEIVSKKDHHAVSVRNQVEHIDEVSSDDVFDKKIPIMGYTGNRFGGIGISLPVCKEIVSAYKGQIWAKNEMGKGFVVTFTLPKS
jgi:K+-sensing histidine kinase KdpD